MLKVKVVNNKQVNVLNNFLANGLINEIPIAIWSMPFSKDFSSILSTNSHSAPHFLNIEASRPGFAIAPFNDIHPAYFLEAEYYYSTANGMLLSDQSRFGTDDFLKEYISMPNLLEYTGNSISSQDYKEIVLQAIDKIASGEFKKVVVARQEVIEIDQLNLVELLYKLRSEYPAAFVSLIYIPTYGLWIGATPELLLEVSKDKIFKTVALAGTQKKGSSNEILKISWTQKEIEEQALVNRYIINCFKHLRLREYEDEGPRTVSAGNLLHLRTDFSVDMKKLEMLNLGTQMLHLLHPTSAVGGMPKEEALQFIDYYESTDRKLFSGYLGPVNIEKSSSLFVNLRCANIFRKHAVLYAGAGITQDSEAEKELLETELKMNTIGKYLKMKSNFGLETQDPL